MSNMRVLLDANMLVAGLTRSRGASYALLQAVAAARLEMASSPALWLEYEAVLKRDEIRALHGFGAHEINALLAALAVWTHPARSRDPGGRSTRPSEWTPAATSRRGLFHSPPPNLALPECDLKWRPF